MFGLNSFVLLVMGCFQWGSRAGRHLPEYTALDKSYEYDGEVIVIGAGAAGLAAARVLEENDISYIVLEATDHYGGRLQEDRGFADFPMDLGAEWIHNTPEVLDVLSGDEGVSETIELIPYHLEEVYSWDGEEYGETSQVFLNRYFAFFPEYKFKNSTWFSFVEEYYANGVVDRIQFNNPVTQVDYSGEGVQVTTQAGEVFEADKVLVTVSVGVLKSGNIDFIPDLSEDKQEAFDTVEFQPGVKMFFKFSEKFYPDVVNVPVDSGEKAFYDIAFKKEANDHVLGLLVTGSSSSTYTNLDSEELVVQTVLAELDEIFDGEATANYLGEYRIENWGERPYTQGTWVVGAQISKRTLNVLNEPLSGKVYFAGEVNDVYQQMGVPGSILSGLEAIDRLLIEQ